jgi:hypothetical protein
MNNKIDIDSDAFSSSQIQSKIWLVSTLESIVDKKYHRIWILAGWYGITNFILRTRNNIPVSEVRSFDIDPACESIADQINNLWHWQGWQFKAETKDINDLDYSKPPDIVINSSAEHIENDQWFHRIPPGVLVCIQTADLDHEEHISEYKSLDDLIARFPLEIKYQGIKRFEYDDFGFNRYMIVGFKLPFEPR